MVKHWGKDKVITALLLALMMLFQMSSMIFGAIAEDSEGALIEQAVEENVAPVEVPQEEVKEEEASAQGEEKESAAPAEETVSEEMEASKESGKTVEETVEKEPEEAAEEAPVEEPTVEEPTVEEPAEEESTVEESAVEESAVEESAVEESAVEESTVEEPTEEESTVEEPAVEERIVEELTVEEATVEESAAEEPSVEETQEAPKKTAEETEGESAEEEAEEIVSFEQEIQLGSMKVIVSAEAGTFGEDAGLNIQKTENDQFVEAVDAALDVSVDEYTTVNHMVLSMSGSEINGSAQLTFTDFGIKALKNRNPDASITVKVYRCKEIENKDEVEAEEYSVKVKEKKDKVSFIANAFGIYDVVTIVCLPAASEETAEEGQAAETKTEEEAPAEEAPTEETSVEETPVAEETATAKITLKKFNEIRLRVEKSTSAEYICKVANGSIVSVLENDGEWSLIRTEDGKEGYIQSQYLTGEEETQEAPEETAEEGQATEAKTEEKVSAEEAPAEEASVEETSVAEETPVAEETVTAKIILKKFNEIRLRVEKSTSAKYICKVANGSSVSVLENDGEWSLIRTEDGKEGYIQSEYLVSETQTPVAATIDIETEEEESTETVDTLPLEDAPLTVADTPCIVDDSGTDAKIVGVWYDKAYENRSAFLHVTTNLDAQYLYMYLGDELYATWNASDPDITITTGTYNKEWNVKYTFQYSGGYNLRYAASNDGETKSTFVTKKLTVNCPDIVEVWYESGFENRPLGIHVTTSLDMNYLHMYLGDEELGSWSAGDEGVVIEEYSTRKTWTIKHTFQYSGDYALWYRASAENGDLSGIAYGKTVTIKCPDIVDVWYESGYENRELGIHVTTSLDMNYLHMYLGDEELGSWSAGDEGVVIEEYSTRKTWTIKHTFQYSGNYDLWYRASAESGDLSGIAYGKTVTIKCPDIVDVWYESGYENRELGIHVTTSLDMNYLHMYLGDEELGSWSAGDEGVAIEEYSTRKTWTIKHTFQYSGDYDLWYRASAENGDLSGIAYGKTVTIKCPDIVDVWYETGYKNKPLEIHITTSLEMQYVHMYLDVNELACWAKGDENVVIETYSTRKTWTVKYTFEEAGNIDVWYKASAESGTPTGIAFGKAVTVYDALSASVACGSESPALGDSVTWTVSAEGGKGSYTYDYELFLDGESLNKVEGSAEASYEYPLAAAGTYQLTVTVKDSGTASSTVKSESVVISPVENLTVSVACATEAPVIGEKIVWNVTVENGTAPYTYDYELFLDDKSFDNVEGSSEASYEYTLEVAGTYLLTVTVKDSGTASSTVKSEPVVISPVESLTVSVACATEAPVIGEKIIWNVTVEDGTVPYTYDYELFLDGQSLGKVEGSSEASYEYTLAAAGTYQLTVTVKDSGTASSTVKSEPVVISPVESLNVSVACATEAPVIGEKIVWYVTVENGTAPYTYDYELLADGQSIVNVKASTETSYEYTPTVAGTYQLTVTVHDAASATGQAESESITIADALVALVECVTAAPARKQAATWNVTVTGGVAPYTYNYKLLLDEVSINELEGCADASYTYTLDEGGTYKLIVTVKDSAQVTTQVTSDDLVISKSDFLYQLNDENTITITGYLGDAANLVIPETVDDYSVTVIGENAFQDRTDLAGKLTLPATVTEIAENAFSGCTALTSISGGENISLIGKRSFYGCSSLSQWE